MDTFDHPDALLRQQTTFGQFRSSPEKIASNILAARLQKLVELDIFKKVPDEKHKLKVHYQLTKKGRDLKDVLLAVGSWGHKHIDNTFDIVKKNKDGLMQAQLFDISQNRL